MPDSATGRTCTAASRAGRGGPGELDGSGDELEALLKVYFQNDALSGIFTLVSLIRMKPEDKRERLASLDYRSLDRDEHWLLAMGMLSDLAFELEEQEILEWLYQELKPYGHLMGVHDLLRASTGSMRACLGQVATGLELYDEAVEHYEAAIESERAARARPAMAQSMGGAARALLRRGRAGDVERAKDWMAQLERVSHELGTRHYELTRQSLAALMP